MTKLEVVLKCSMSEKVLNDCIKVIDKKVKEDVSPEKKKSYCKKVIKRRILNENLSIQQLKEVFEHNPCTFNCDIREKIRNDIDVLLDNATEELVKIVDGLDSPGEE